MRGYKRNIGSRNQEMTMKNVEKKVEQMGAKNEEMFSMISKIMQKPNSTGHLQWDSQTLADLMNKSDSFDDDQESLNMPRSSESSAMSVRNRTLERQSEPVRKSPKAAPKVKNEAGITASYVFYRFLFMFIAIFVVPFITSYFRQ